MKTTSRGVFGRQTESELNNNNYNNNNNKNNNNSNNNDNNNKNNNTNDDDDDDEDDDDDDDDDDGDDKFCQARYSLLDLSNNYWRHCSVLNLLIISTLQGDGSNHWVMW